MSISMCERARSRAATFLVSLLLGIGTAHASTTIDQQPLLVAKPVPGNMAIIGSFEFPTMVTRAYKGNYTGGDEYVGYFDSAKCYEYNYDILEENRYFEPTRIASDCSEENEWSGKYLNWATMQSIDIFRYILTGGYRHLDTTDETVLEKGVQTGQGNSGSNFPDANIGSGLVASSTPVPSSKWNSVKTRIGIGGTRMGNVMRFTDDGNLNDTPTPYDPDQHNKKNNFKPKEVYEVSVRVKVCVKGMLESNCKKYGNNYKPEGLIQENSDNMRYSAFGYINDNSAGSNRRNSEGGLMHARMKYVGPERIDDNNNEKSNPNKEWDENTGVFIDNPDPADALATPSGNSTIVNSGVISYVNKSGLIRGDTEFKRFDNVSELFYTAYRYIKGLGNRSEYINLPSDLNDRARLVGGLPIIDWTASEADDPIQFSCQKNFFLGIGDTNTHPDTRVPKDDDTADIAARVSRISTLEGGLNISGGRSALIAGLAFDANTNDLRSDLDGKQTASTYWIDILEGGDLKSRRSNQYWLAAKYGGLKIPEDFNPDSDPVQESMWHTTGDTLSNGNQRPDNFYVVASAQDLVNGLIQAFADIQKEQTGNRSSLALNSTTLDAGSATFQAQYTSGIWTGDLNAFTLDQNTGALSSSPAWTASSKLPLPANRNIKTWNGSAFVNFTTSTGGINNPVLTGLLRADSGTGANAADIVNYLRGARTNENNATGFRVRQGVLGDIVNSQPVFIGNPTPGLFRGQTFSGASDYQSWAGGLSRTPTVYVGSNDGMLHGFNATTGGGNSGVETFAYIPKTVIENGLGELASPAYNHRYFVDGELTVADAYDGTDWRTILVGTLGAGSVAKDRSTTSNAIYALDVTDPANVKFLWEKNSTAIPALGNSLGKPIIAQIADGTWSVLLGNGPNSSGDTAQVVSVNLFSGAVKSTEMSADVDNGLSAPRAWDSDGDGVTDTLYAGDLQGNLWKVTGLTNTNWTVQKLFQAVDVSNNPQPITSSPLAGRSPYSQEVWLFFGTGQYLNNSDLSDMSVQTWYGINDDESTTTVSRSDLLERKILLDVAVSTDVTARVIESGAREDLLGKRGWYIDLYSVASDGTRSALGERMVTQNQFQGSALIGNTRIPDASDPCAPSGRGVIMSIDPFTGARLVETFFDINGDSVFNAGDLIEIDGVPTVVSGLALNTGFSNPSFLDKKMYIPTDDGSISTLDINPFSTGASRTSWRELINTGN
ncbi:pilus assembly protein [Marinobacter antarcticus]|nr:PilC/PilY family type IV pilus protein [Marinobacter antarcticus]